MLNYIKFNKGSIMIREIIYTLCLSSISLMALDTGDKIPQNIQEQLNLDNNKTYIIDFFASWCKSCKHELPLVAKIHNQQVAEVIGVNVDKKRELGKAFVEKLNLPFKVVYDIDKRFIEAFNPLGFPAIYYVKNGKVVHVIFGAVDKIDEQIAKDLKDIK